MDSSIYWDISFTSMSLHLQHEHPERHLLCWRCTEHYTRTTESQLNSLVQTTAFNASINCSAPPFSFFTPLPPHLIQIQKCVLLPFYMPLCNSWQNSTCDPMSPPQQHTLFYKSEASHQFIPLGISFPFPVSTYCINLDQVPAALRLTLNFHFSHAQLSLSCY